MKIQYLPRKDQHIVILETQFLKSYLHNRDALEFLFKHLRIDYDDLVNDIETRTYLAYAFDLKEKADFFILEFKDNLALFEVGSTINGIHYTVQDSNHIVSIDIKLVQPYLNYPNSIEDIFHLIADLNVSSLIDELKMRQTKSYIFSNKESALAFIERMKLGLYRARNSLMLREPQDLPKEDFLWGACPPEIEGFIGREQELQTLQNLQNSKVASFFGLGGLGKTQLVAKFVHQQQNAENSKYSLIVWLRGDPSFLENDLIQLEI